MMNIPALWLLIGENPKDGTSPILALIPAVFILGVGLLIGLVVYWWRRSD